MLRPQAVLPILVTVVMLAFGAVQLDAQKYFKSRVAGVLIILGYGDEHWLAGRR